MANQHRFDHSGPTTGPREPSPGTSRKSGPRPGDSGPRLLCHLGRHEPFARQANWTGEHYVSKCEHCSAPIRRVSAGKWVKDNGALEYL